MENREKFELPVPREHWSEVQCSGAAPAPRSGHIAVLYQSRAMVVFGGHDGTNCLSDLWLLDLPRKVQFT